MTQDIVRRNNVKVSGNGTHHYPRMSDPAETIALISEYLDSNVAAAP